MNSVIKTTLKSRCNIIRLNMILDFYSQKYAVNPVNVGYRRKPYAA